ncbi:MAG: hypothetical protein ACE5NP_09275 [Anaerolineae bacterium]
MSINDQILVVDKLADDMIVGAHTMQGWRIKLDLEKEEVIMDPSAARLRL